MKIPVEYCGFDLVVTGVYHQEQRAVYGSDPDYSDPGHPAYIENMEILMDVIYNNQPVTAEITTKLSIDAVNEIHELALMELEE